MESKRALFVAHLVSIMDWGLKTWTVSWLVQVTVFFWGMYGNAAFSWSPYYKETSANRNVFQSMLSTMQCGSATVFLVPFPWVSPLLICFTKPPGGEVSHPVHHACARVGGPLYIFTVRTKSGKSTILARWHLLGVAPLPKCQWPVKLLIFSIFLVGTWGMRTHFFKESFRKLGEKNCLPAPGTPGNPPSVLFRVWNERCHDLKSMEIIGRWKMRWFKNHPGMFF